LLGDFWSGRQCEDHGTLVGGGAGNRKCSTHSATRKATIAAPMVSYLSQRRLVLR
jgi:hypothetical protein